MLLYNLNHEAYTTYPGGGKTVHIVLKCLSRSLLVERGEVGWSHASPPLTTLFLSSFVDVFFKDDLSVIHLGVSFMAYINLPLLLLRSTKTTCPTLTSILFDVEYTKHIVFKEKTEPVL